MLAQGLDTIVHSCLRWFPGKKSRIKRKWERGSYLESFCDYLSAFLRTHPLTSSHSKVTQMSHSICFKTTSLSCLPIASDLSSSREWLRRCRSLLSSWDMWWCCFYRDFREFFFVFLAKPDACSFLFVDILSAIEVCDFCSEFISGTETVGNGRPDMTDGNSKGFLRAWGRLTPLASFLPLATSANDGFFDTAETDCLGTIGFGVDTAGLGDSGPVFS